jgi:hypothetical protein
LWFQIGQIIDKDHAAGIDTLSRGTQRSHGAVTVIFFLAQTRVGDCDAYDRCDAEVRIIAASLKAALIESEVP